MKKDKKLILLVEDDSFLQSLYNDLLNGEGYNVTVSQDGAEALKLIQEKNWDLILLDIMLPHLTGFEILLKAKEANKALSNKTIFLTNLDASSEDITKLKAAHDYWIKSDMTPPEFIQKVSSFFS